MFSVFEDDDLFLWNCWLMKGVTHWTQDVK